MMHIPSLSIPYSNVGTMTTRIKDYVKDLLDAGAHPDWGNRFGDTAMHACAAEGDIDTFQLLLKYGGDINIKNRRGSTPFLKAIEGGKFQVVCQIIRLNCHVDSIWREFSYVDGQKVVTEEKDALYYLTHYNQRPMEESQIENAAIMVRMIIAAGYNARSAISDWITEDKWPHQMDTCLFSEPDKAWLMSYSECPLALKKLCRIVVRNAIGYPYVSRITENTDLPPGIKAYLMFNDFQLSEIPESDEQK